MPETPEQLYARVVAASDKAGRLPLSRMTGWEVFPFEAEGLQVVPLEPPELPEPGRAGAGGVDCRGCLLADPVQSGGDEIWRDDRWRLVVFPESGVPLLLMLSPLAHHDLGDLPDDLAGELGRLQVHLARAVESLPHVARCHVSRWGDGGEHLHVFFYARPEGFGQLRGTCLAVWDDLLPPAPHEMVGADARAVALALAASYGGAARSPSGPGTR